jgi:hypothetical protein
VRYSEKWKKARIREGRLWKKREIENEGWTNRSRQPKDDSEIINPYGGKRRE